MHHLFNLGNVPKAGFFISPVEDLFIMPIYCDNCGHQNRDTAAFCQGCGGNIVATTSDGNIKAGVLLNKNYEIRSLIKKGGMGAVYLAKDHRFDSDCAVKEMLVNSANPKDQQYMIDSFKREAKILRNLRHPNIPVVLDYFIEAGRYYLVMDYIDGKDLDTILMENGKAPISERMVVKWTCEILDAFIYLHSQKPPLIYRDLKPANVMLRKDGRIILIDFGIARTIIHGSNTTKTGIGTPIFAPKELLMGKPEIRSDIYCIGATMNCLLTGVFPVIPCDFKPVREHNPDVSQALDAIVMQALSMNIEDRYSSAKEMKTALENISCLTDAISSTSAKDSSVNYDTSFALTTPTIKSSTDAVESPLNPTKPTLVAPLTEVASITPSKVKAVKKPSKLDTYLEARDGRNNVKKPSKRGTSKGIISVITGVVILLLVSGMVMRNYMDNILTNQENNAPQGKPYVETVDGVSFDMVYIDGGTFDMGSNNSESDEKPVHSVTVSSFYMGKHEVTNDEYSQYDPNHKGNWSNSDYPVENVSWEDAVKYCKWLSKNTSKNYRLPTEAEWEYACRSGSTTEYYWGDEMDDSYCWYGNNLSGVHPVGQKKPNKFGLYDMSGNVWEYCNDWYGEYPSDNLSNPIGNGSGSYRVIRGGSWLNDTSYCCSANRSTSSPNDRNDNVGFRLVMTKTPPQPNNNIISLPKPTPTYKKKKLESEMLYIEGGTFLMGSNISSFENEKPVHSVTISSFHIGKYEVTNREYCQHDTSHSNPGDDLPVVNVSWEDAVEYCKWLSEKTGKNYRLPTEAEWEYACRAGTTTDYYWGENMNPQSGDSPSINNYAWYYRNTYYGSSGSENLYKVHPVGQKKPNAWGLYDMAGNVYEWCSDWYGIYPSGSVTNPTGPSTGSLRVNRGGGCNSAEPQCRSAFRLNNTPSDREYCLGFRLCRSAP